MHDLNPRLAEACSQCTSRDLSTPQPKVPLRWRLISLVVQWLSAAGLSVFALNVIGAMLDDFRLEAHVRHSRLITAAILIALWLLWSILLDFFRRLTRRSIKHGKEPRK